MAIRAIFICAVVLLVFNVPIVAFQDSDTFYYTYGFKEFGAVSGFQWGNLKNKDHYEVIPLMLHFGFDLRPLIKNKSNILLEFLLKPFINSVTNPDDGAEIGNNFILKFAVPIKERIYPYIEGGCGLIYLTQDISQQATRFNFTSQLGAGITYFLKKNLNLSIGYRYRHVSNASIKRPNNGIDTNCVIGGISFLY